MFFRRIVSDSILFLKGKTFALREEIKEHRVNKKFTGVFFCLAGGWRFMILRKEMLFRRKKRIFIIVERS